MVKRKICLFSGKRGGFGAYLPLMQLIDKDPKLELQILLGDMHTSKKFGATAKEAEEFFPNSKIELIRMGTDRGDSPLIRAENLGECLRAAAQILSKLKPEILLVHADRGEHLVVAFAALNLGGIAVAHTQGGEVSGNIDDVLRHAITKLAHLHFSETEAAAQRLRSLGEESWRIHVTGSLYIDRIAKKMYTPATRAKKKYGLNPDENYFIIIFHPDTYETPKNNYLAMGNLLKAAKTFNLKSLIIYPCSDPGYEGVLKAIGEVRRDGQFLIHKNIENLDFLGLMASAQAIIGNSSSALVEAPYFKLPAINIGRREAGRDREENVLDAEPTVVSITKAVNHALKDQGFRSKLKNCGYRLGNGRASEKILSVLKSIPINSRLFRKKLVLY